jgi:hypothetical protein
MHKMHFASLDKDRRLVFFFTPLACNSIPIFKRNRLRPAALLARCRLRLDKAAS